MNTYYVPSDTLSIELYPFNALNNPLSCYFYHEFMNDKTETERGEGHYLWSCYIANSKAGTEIAEQCTVQTTSEVGGSVLSTMSHTATLSLMHPRLQLFYAIRSGGGG